MELGALVVDTGAGSGVQTSETKDLRTNNSNDITDSNDIMNDNNDKRTDINRHETKWTGLLLSARSASLLQGHSSVVTTHVWPGLQGGASHDRLLALLDSGATCVIMSQAAFQRLPGEARAVLLTGAVQLGTIASTRGFLAQKGVVTLSGVAPDGILRGFRCTVALVPEPVVPGWRFDIIFPLPQHVEQAQQYFFEKVALGLPCAVAHDAVASGEAALRHVGTAYVAPVSAAALLRESDLRGDAYAAGLERAVMRDLEQRDRECMPITLERDGAYVQINLEERDSERSVVEAIGAFAAIYSSEDSMAAPLPVDLQSAEALAFRAKVVEHLAAQAQPPISAPHTMTEAETERLIEVLVTWQMRHKCFDPGGPILNMPGFAIPTTSDKPYNEGHLGAFRRFSPEQLKSVKDQIDANVLAGRWVWYNPQLHQEPWVHSLVYALKDATTARLAVNFIPLNRRTVPIDQTGQPSAAYCLNAMQGYERYVALDAENWFFQLPVRAEDMHKTGVYTPWGILLMRSIGQGQLRSSAYGQATMEVALQPFLEADPDKVNVHATPYQDDGVLAANDQPGISANMRLIDAVERVLARTGPLGVRWRLSKCRFCVAAIVMLGEIVSKEGRRITPERLQGIRNLQAPTSKDELRSFLGLAGHFRTYVPHFSGIAAILTDLTQQYARFNWTREHQAAFQHIKNSLLESNVLCAFPRGCRCYFYTDGATRLGAGLGAWIVVEFAPGVYGTYAFWSRKMTPAEANISATDAEATAGSDGMSAFYHVLRHAREIIWVTDHMNLTWFSLALSRPETMLGRTARAFDKIFNELHLPVSKVVYSKGAENCVADALSRMHGPPTTEDLAAEATSKAASLAGLSARLVEGEAAQDLTVQALRQAARSWQARRANAALELRPRDPPLLALAALGLGLGQTVRGAAGAEGGLAADLGCSACPLGHVAATGAVTRYTADVPGSDDAPAFSRAFFATEPRHTLGLVAPERHAEHGAPIGEQGQPARLAEAGGAADARSDAYAHLCDGLPVTDLCWFEEGEAHGGDGRSSAVPGVGVPLGLGAGALAVPADSLAIEALRAQVITRPTSHLGAAFLPAALFKDVAALQRVTSLKVLRGVLRGAIEAVERFGHTVLAIEYNGVARVLIPQGPQRELLLSYAHACDGHFAVRRNYQALLDAHVIWPDMKADCERFAASCVECLRTNGGHGPTPPKVGLITGLYRANYPMQQVQADFMGPFPVSVAGNSYILTIVDKFSRYVVLAALAKLDFPSFAKAFQERWIAYFEPPELLLHDGGPPFNSTEIDRLISEIGIAANHHVTHAKHPASIGLVERTNQTVAHLLQKLANHNPRRWCQYLPLIQAAINRQIASSTGVAPRDAILRLAQPTALQRITGALQPRHTAATSAQALALDSKDTAAMVKLIQERDRKAAQDMAEHYNASARPATRFQAGDRVFVWVDPSERAASPAGSKLTPPYAGPYKVAGISTDATGSRDFYVLDHMHESRGRPIVRHVSFLRRDTSGMSDLEAQIEARPVEEVQVRVVDHYDQALGGKATGDSPDGTYFRVTYAYPTTGKPWFYWNTKQPNGRYDHFYLIDDCQRYLRERGLKLDAVGHLVFRDDATDEQRRAHEAHERMIMNRIATKTTELDLLEAQAREVRPSRGDPQLLKHEVDSLWARAAELEASEKTTRRPPPASAQPPRSALKGSAPEARRKVTHHVGIAAPGQATEGEPSSADGGPSIAAASDAPAEAATDRPEPLYSRGMLLAKRSDGLWGIAAAPVWIDTGVATPGYFYHIAWQDATDRTKKSRVSREPEAALQPKDDAVPRRRRGSSA